MRPRRRRNIEFSPRVSFYKPQGIPLRLLDVVNLTHEEIEAMRLKYHQGLDQIASAERMHTSQSTFQRILSSANRKVAEALIDGKAIRIENEEG